MINKLKVRKNLLLEFDILVFEGQTQNWYSVDDIIHRVLQNKVCCANNMSIMMSIMTRKCYSAKTIRLLNKWLCIPNNSFCYLIAS